MTYSMRAKQECCAAPIEKGCELTLLSAIVHTCGTVVRSARGAAVKLTSENEQLLRLAERLISRLFSIKTEIDGREAVLTDGAEHLLEQCRLMDFEGGRITRLIAGIDPVLLKAAGARAAYLRGAFLGAGSLSTSRGYHLEIAASSKMLADDLAALLSDVGLACHSFERKEKYVVYMKRASDICDFLSLTGATNVMLELAEKVVESNVSKQINSRTNLELSNMDRTINVAVEQAEAVRLIEEQAGLDTLEDKLLEVARLRVEDESLSYDDMAKKLGISKGSVRYRLRRIIAEADKYRAAPKNRREK